MLVLSQRDEVSSIVSDFTQEIKDFNSDLFASILGEYEYPLREALKKGNLGEDRREIIMSQATKKFTRNSERNYEKKRDEYFAKIRMRFFTLINLHVIFNN